MKKMFRINLLVLVIVATAISGCHHSKKVFISSFLTMHDPFFISLNEGIKKAVVDHGDSVVFLNGNHNQEKEQEDIIKMLEKNKIAAIFICPATHDGCIDKALAAAKKKGVPVIVVDADLNIPDSTMYLCKVISDNVGAGKMSCDELAKVNPKAKVGILSFSLSKSCVDRVKGFTDEMAKYPDMTVIGTQDGHANKDGVNGVIKEFLAKTPDMDAIFAINDVSAIAANEGIEKAGLSGKITVLGIAGSKEGAQAIKDGKMLSTCAQEPMEIGRVTVDKAYDFIAGKKVEKDVRVPVKLVTKDNADDYIK